MRRLASGPSGVGDEGSLRPVVRRVARQFQSSLSGGRSMTSLQVSAQKQLRQLVEQIERLEEEKKALAGDIRDKYLEAKGVGFDPKALRKIVSLRKKSQTDRQEEEAILAVYMHALGMLDEASAPS